MTYQDMPNIFICPFKWTESNADPYEKKTNDQPRKLIIIFLKLKLIEKKNNNFNDSNQIKLVNNVIELLQAVIHCC